MNIANLNFENHEEQKPLCMIAQGLLPVSIVPNQDSWGNYNDAHAAKAVGMIVPNQDSWGNYNIAMPLVIVNLIVPNQDSWGNYNLENLGELKTPDCTKPRLMRELQLRKRVLV